LRLEEDLVQNSPTGRKRCIADSGTRQGKSTATVNHWDRFKFLFNEDKQRFTQAMDSGNKYRADAHAKSLTTEQFRTVMPQLVWLMKCFEENS